MEQGNRVAAYRLYIADAPKSIPSAEKLYNALIAMDAQFCLQKVNGSITLHYSSGNLSKIHETKVI